MLSQIYHSGQTDLATCGYGGGHSFSADPPAIWRTEVELLAAARQLPRPKVKVEEETLESSGNLEDIQELDPEEIIEHLANNELEDLINKFDLDPEMLIWGMVHILELTMKIAEIQPDQLATMLDEYIDWKEKNGD